MYYGIGNEYIRVCHEGDRLSTLVPPSRADVRFLFFPTMKEAFKADVATILAKNVGTLLKF